MAFVLVIQGTRVRIALLLLGTVQMSALEKESAMMVCASANQVIQEKTAPSSPSVNFVPTIALFVVAVSVVNATALRDGLVLIVPSVCVLETTAMVTVNALTELAFALVAGQETTVQLRNVQTAVPIMVNATTVHVNVTLASTERTALNETAPTCARTTEFATTDCVSVSLHTQGRTALKLDA